MTNKKTIFEREYDGYSLIDVERDVYEALDECDLPIDEGNIHKGTFKVTITWEDDDES